MTHPAILSQLSNLQAMMGDLARGLPADDARRRWHPRLAPLAWYLGRAVYRELHWLREVLTGDADLADRVRPIFATGEEEASGEGLPPLDHLLAWAEEVWGEHLRRLATPGAWPNNALMQHDRLAWFLLQETAKDYEAMLWVLLARRLTRPEAAPDGEPLLARPPTAAAVEITQGHYRVGARGDPIAYDHELPPQAVELSNFRIAPLPVTNAEFLGFMLAGGYARLDLWDPPGQAWLSTQRSAAPWHWRQDDQGQWYALGLKGARTLSAEEPVSGLSRHEARAYAAWVASLGEASPGPCSNMNISGRSPPAPATSRVPAGSGSGAPTPATPIRTSAPSRTPQSPQPPSRPSTASCGGRVSIPQAACDAPVTVIAPIRATAFGSPACVWSSHPPEDSSLPQPPALPSPAQPRLYAALQYNGFI